MPEDSGEALQVKNVVERSSLRLGTEAGVLKNVHEQTMHRSMIKRDRVFAISPLV
jgi:hypothetical protein